MWLLEARVPVSITTCAARRAGLGPRPSGERSVFRQRESRAEFDYSPRGQDEPRAAPTLSVSVSPRLLACVDHLAQAPGRRLLRIVDKGSNSSTGVILAANSLALSARIARGSLDTFKGLRSWALVNCGVLIVVVLLAGQLRLHPRCHLGRVVAADLGSLPWPIRMSRSSGFNS
jgi:hypothetical protein